MTHIKSVSFRVPGDNIRGRERLIDNVGPDRGRILGEYDSIGAANHAAELISHTSEIKPRRKPRNYNPKGTR